MLKKPKNSTAVEIREFLRKTQPNYVWATWHHLRFEAKVTRMRYSSFMSYFRTLEKLQLIVRTSPPRTQPSIPTYRRTGRLKSVPRVWFVLNLKNLNSEAWRHPERSLHPETFLLTHRPRGRPPGSPNKKKK